MSRNASQMRLTRSQRLRKVEGGLWKTEGGRGNAKPWRLHGELLSRRVSPLR
jgi:hypothetical protein